MKSRLILLINSCEQANFSFFFLYEPELTPAGLNLVDGRNAAFGYVVEGFDVLTKLSIEDKIIAIKVVEGAELLKDKG